MVAIVETRLGALQDLCRRFGVRRLEIFGSVTRDDFDPARSDIDVLVAFGSDAAMTPFEQYFGFKEAAERLFGRNVDVVADGASDNPDFLRSVNANRQLVYEA